MYFSLGFDPAETGRFPQAQDLDNQYFLDAPNSFRNAINNGLLHDLYLPDKVELHYHAKYTDMLAIVPISLPYLVVSERFLSVIERIRTPEYYVYPIKISKGKKQIEYYIFILKDGRFPQYINLKTCSATIFHKPGPGILPVALKEVSFSSYEDYVIKKAALNPGSYFRITHFELNIDSIAHDIFLMPRGIGHARYIVSETFVDIARSFGLSGLKFRAFPEEIHSLGHIDGEV